jgi:hydroxymethylbilane synthase
MTIPSTTPHTSGSTTHSRRRAVVKIGTRGSQLALFQANTVAALLREHASVRSEIVVIKTSGDRLAEAPLSQIGGKRLFVKELEDALLGGEIDLAVHSSKDMSVVLPDGLAIGAVLPREDARDAVVLRADAAFQEGGAMDALVRTLGPAPRIGTSSVRRSAQLARLWPGAAFAPVRGNLDTRLRKLDDGGFDALVLASAGLRRLDRAQRISASLPVADCVPAPGQGIIAVEVRAGDDELRRLVARIDDAAAAAALTAERAVVVRLGGGCQMPIGAYAEVTVQSMSLTAIVTTLDGTRTARADGRGSTNDPERLGLDVAEKLLANGADAILTEVRRAQASVEGLQP